MDAKKCDRCSKYYDFDTRTQIEIKGKKTYGIAWELYHTASFIDLCPDCLIEFKKWFERS